MYLKLLVTLGLLFSLTYCASSGKKEAENNSDTSSLSEASMDTATTGDTATNNATNAAADSATSTNETNESDIGSQANKPNAQANHNAGETPPPEISSQPDQFSAAAGGSEAAPQSGPAAKITALDYNANVNGGTVIVKTNRAVTYSTRKNEGKHQFVIELENTLVPTKFRRPYTTKEFGGNIASVNAYQSKGTRSARIVVQLRSDVEPSVSQEGKTVFIAGSGVPESNASANQPETTSKEVANAENSGDSSPAQSSANSDYTSEDENGYEPAVSDTPTSKSTKEEDLSMPSGSAENFLTGNTKFYGRPISIEVKDADIKDVFRFISEESGLNVVAGDDVSGKVTLRLRRIPWDQILMIVLQSKQLGYVRQGNVLRIAPLKTLQAESDSARAVLESQRQLQPLHVQLFPISYAKVEDLEGQAKDFLSPRGKAKGDKRTNTLVVTDIDENLNRIKTLVRKLDTQTPQVLIEAKVVEARETFQRVVGVNWGISGQNNGGGAGQVTATPRFLSAPIPASTGVAADLGVTVGTFDVIGDLNASLKLLELENQVKVISSPRIVTIDRVQAKIEQTTQFPVFSANVLPTGATSAAVSFQDVKLELTVKPQITVDGGIIMDVNILREFPDAPTSPPGSVSQARAVNKRHAETQVIVESGDTVVIGGIYQSDVSEVEVGVPWLRKIPLLGWLFKQNTATRDKNELVIFLTPRVINREKAFVKPEGV